MDDRTITSQNTDMRSFEQQLVMFTLGRGASPKALADMAGRDKASNIAFILTSTEFSHIIQQAIKGEITPHEKRAISLTEGQMWLGANFRLLRSSKEKIHAALTWSEALLTIVRDKRIFNELEDNFKYPQRIEKFRLLANEAKSSVKQSKIVHTLSQPIDESKNNLETKKPQQKISELRQFFTDIYRSDRFRDILFHLEDDKYEGHQEIIAEIFAARVYLRLFLGDSAYKIALKAMEKDINTGLLSDFDRMRLYKTLATAALRSGRSVEGVELLKRISSQWGNDWEIHFQLAEAIFALDQKRALEELEVALALNIDASPNQRLATADYFLQAGWVARGRVLALPLARLPEKRAEYDFFQANVALRHGDQQAWRQNVSQAFRNFGLDGYCILEEDPKGLFRFGRARLSHQNDHPSVTIVMTTFNSEQTVEASLLSVIAQTCTNLKIVVVDDCSTDKTVEIVKCLQEIDSRIQLIINAQNMGTYRSKNTAISQSSCDFVTLHDSDDWMHPQRIEKQLDIMSEDAAVGMSNWVRMSESGVTLLRKGGTFTHRNPASTFFRSEVFKRVGYFDSVRVGADSEMLSRVQITLGVNAVVVAPAVLGVGLHHDRSLTQAGVTAFDEHRYSPVRSQYAEAWTGWHLKALHKKADYYVPFPLVQREFNVPTEIL